MRLENLFFSRSKKSKLYLFLSLLGNLGILGFFKYYNFFIESFDLLFKNFGLSTNPSILNIVLPVGISFYTFQTLSYTIDIYKKELKPTANFIDFALFVSFFPQLVAGPIERAKNLLPQIINKRTLTLTRFYEGCYLIFWGLFQKMFIADNLSNIVDPIFSGTLPYTGTAVLISLYAFAFQIFCDFAGYTNIARGLSKCLGIELMINFNLPYFSSNPREFWQRWHISLSTWLKDYLYIPLGGNKKNTLHTFRNLSITMLLGGLWHGAAWTFVIWGAYHSILLIGHRIVQLICSPISCITNKFIQKIWKGIKIILFFHLICLGWLFFRAESFAQIDQMLNAIHINDFIKVFSQTSFKDFLFYTGPLLVIQLLQYTKKDLMVIYKLPTIMKSMIYCILFYLWLYWAIEGGKEFVYFQF